MLVLLFIMGLVFGSFYNVVGLRLPEGKSIIFPSSHCPKCNHKLKWYENIPVLSFLFLKGKCSVCMEKISIIYPLIELLTGLLFVLSYTMFGISEEFFISLIISSLVVIIFVSDTKYMIILDSPLVISIVLIGIVKFIYNGYIELLVSLGYGVLLFIVMYLIMLLGNFLFKRESLGGGDIKLSFVSGFILGPFLGLFYIVLGSFLALPYAIYVTIKNKEGILPFGPFLGTSLLIIYLNYDKIVDIFKMLF